MSCRVTVIGTRQRLDADLPDAIPVAELLADVASLLGEGQDGAVDDWGLFKVGGARLDPELSLADQGVAEGTMLFLRDAATAPAPPQVDDFVDRVAVAVDAQEGRWTAKKPVSLLAWVAAGALGAAGLTVLVAGDASGQATAGVLGAVISGLAAFALVRVLGRRELAAGVMLVSLPAWSAAGVGIAGLAGASVPMSIALGLAGVAIGALAVVAVAGEVATALVDGVFEATAVPAVVIGVAAAFGAGLLQSAAGLVVLEVILLAATPVLTARVLGAVPNETVALALRLTEGRRVASASRTAAAVVIVASCAVLVSSGRGYAIGLVAATALATVLRARHYRFAGEVAPLLVAGIVGVLLLELPLAAWLAIGIRGAAGLSLLLIADAVVLVAGAVGVRSWTITPRVARWLRPLEFVAVAATVPLAFGVLGLYDAVAHFARGLG